MSDATSHRAAMVDDMICDCIQSLSLKRHKGKERQIIERCAQQIVERVDATRENQSENVKIEPGP